MRKTLIIGLFALGMVCNLGFGVQKTRQPNPVNDEYDFRRRILEDNNRIVERLDRAGRSIAPTFRSYFESDDPMKKVNSYQVKIWAEAVSDSPWTLVFREAPNIDQILQVIDAQMVGTEGKKLAMIQQVLIAASMNKTSPLWNGLDHQVIVAGIKIGAFYVKHVEEWIEEQEPIRRVIRNECGFDPASDIPGVDF